MKENRADPRFDISLSARWQGSQGNHNVRISDLSVGGCYVDTIVEVIVGEVLFLQILLPDGQWIEFQGVVAHRAPRLGFGVRFVNLDENQCCQIRSLLMKENPNPIFCADSLESRKFLIPLEKIDLTSRTIM